MCRERAGYIALAVSLLCCICVLGSAAAGQVQTLPSQQFPEPARTPPQLNRQPGGNPPPLQLPGPQENTREIPLPQVFRGCWSGSVPTVDSVRRLRADAINLLWLTKTYTLCYKQAGFSGKWQLTFAEGRVANTREASDQRQAIKVKSVSGPDRAELTAYLHFRTHPIVTFWTARKEDTLDELTHLRCDVTPERDRMAVRAIVFVERNGEPDVSLTWHANFFRAISGPFTESDPAGNTSRALVAAYPNRFASSEIARAESIVLKLLPG